MDYAEIQCHEHDDDFRRDGDRLAHSGLHQPPQAEIILQLKAIIVLLACGAGLMAVLAVQRAWNARQHQNGFSRLIGALLTVIAGMTVGGAVGVFGVYAGHAAGLL